MCGAMAWVRFSSWGLPSEERKKKRGLFNLIKLANKKTSFFFLLIIIPLFFFLFPSLVASFFFFFLALLVFDMGYTGYLSNNYYTTGAA